jgi:GT2 family glycosyltransferase
VTFLDDDVELAPDYLVKVRTFLASHPEVVLVNGRLLKNGNVTRAEAIAIIDKASSQSPDESFKHQEGAYGCNMTMRRDTLTRVQFDERLRSNGWLEDADFSLRCGQYGISATYHGCRLVHLMVVGGRVSGTRSGFSQIMNPYYLCRKRLIGRRELVLRHWIPALRNNLVKLLLQDRRVDRLGRLRGNLTAFGLIMKGRCEPEYVERLT